MRRDTWAFCSLGRAVNGLVHDINRSFILINLTCTLLGILCCYLLARSFDVGRKPALIAAGVYSSSICLLYYSNVAVAYAVEGMFATLIGLLCHRAIRGRSVRCAVGHGMLGDRRAFRPTTTGFLALLWFYSVWRAGSRKWIPLHVVLAVPIVFGWMSANRYFLEARSGFTVAAGKELWRAHFVSPADYSFDSLSVNPDRGDDKPSYHVAFLELIVWADRRLGPGLTLGAGLPEPSLGHAMRWSGIALLKFSYFLLFSMPALAAVLAALVLGRGGLAWPARADLIFLAMWMLPPTAFFVLGHFGSFGYLQIYLSACAVLVVYCLFGPQGAAVPAGNGALKIRRILAGFGMALAVVGLLFFMAVPPLRQNAGWAKAFDIVALQYSGRAIRQCYAISRGSFDPDSPRRRDKYDDCTSDVQLLEAAKRLNWFPKSYYKPPQLPHGERWSREPRAAGPARAPPRGKTVSVKDHEPQSRHLAQPRSHWCSAIIWPSSTGGSSASRPFLNSAGSGC